jgi:3-hydroxyisobutyrate dehydrogenase
MIAVLGLGIMGAALARDAARAGVTTVAWDRNPARGASLISDNLTFVTNVADAVRDAAVVVTMVADADAVMNVMQDLGALAAMKAGASWVQMATIGVEGTDRALLLARTRPEIVFIDAPVSGSRGPAEEGKLVILASGDRERAGTETQRFFEAIATKVHWLGEAGQGTRMKLVFNAWMGLLMEGVAEVASLCDALSVDPATFAELVAGGPLFPAWALQKLRKIIDNGVTYPEFPLRWAEKDVLLALSAAGKARAALPILSEIATVWADAAEDFGAYDLSAVYLALRRRRESLASVE